MCTRATPAVAAKLLECLSDNNADWHEAYAEIHPLLGDPAVFPRSYGEYMGILPKLQTDSVWAFTELSPEVLRIANLYPDMNPTKIVELVGAALSVIITYGIIASARNRE